MLDQITHRGPDSRGTWISQNQRLQLGHVRLAIQDLSPLGHQPMLSESGRFTIVFNGEVYNFKRLAQELRDKGRSFRGHSDTEVMLVAFEEWGVAESLARFDGMFAFAVFDNLSRELWLARDRMGEKPLYYALDEGCLTFCSELKGLQHGLNKKLEIDWVAQGHYFRFGYFPVESTPFSAIRKLPPASYLKLHEEELHLLADLDAIHSRIQCYWTLSENRVQSWSDSSAIDALEDRITAAVCDQSIADVDVGVFLSGGIDSTLVAALLQKNSDRRVATYTVAFDNHAYNEAPFAAEIARHLQTDHHQIALNTTDCLDTVLKLPQLLDEPFADASLIPTFLVCREARKHVKVCLSGDGGDELFGGYNRYIWGEGFQRYALPWPILLRRLLGIAVEAIPITTYDSAWALFSRVKSRGLVKSEKDIGAKLHKLARALKVKNSAQLYRSLMSFWQVSPLLLDKQLDSKVEYFSRIGEAALFSEGAMKADIGGYLVCDNLFKVDRAAMANSLEVRLPLLSREVVEFSNTLPSSLKIRGSTSKWILRQVLYRHVPQSLIDRPKMGFSVPLTEWLRGELKGWAGGVLEDKDFLMHMGLDHNAITPAWRDHLSGVRDNANALWVILCYAKWFNQAEAFVKA
jgi:asparagine synthase (glutamine-hydrolysing)